MSLLLLKSRFKKVFSWLKHHWYVPLLVLALVVAVLIWTVTRNGAYIATLLDVLENSRESYRKEVERKAELEEEFKERGETLDKQKEAELKRLVDEGYNDPERLSRELARLYGLEHG